MAATVSAPLGWRLCSRRRAAAPGRTKGGGADGEGGQRRWCWRPAELPEAGGAALGPAWRGATHPGRSGTDRGSRDGADGIGWRGLDAKRGRRDGALPGA